MARNDFPLPDGWEHSGSFIRQSRPSRFSYNEAYKAKQGTNVEMSYLRLGWLAAHLSYSQMRAMDMVDIGCGNGTFVRCSQGKFRRAVGYDICGDSISSEELYGTRWGLVVLSDVLEHMPDISDLFSKIQWRYAMVSIPETPEVGSFDELRKWRHFKPDEHIWLLDWKGVESWIKNMDPDVRLLDVGDFEDLLRTRWNETVPNISTLLIHRPSGGASTANS